MMHGQKNIKLPVLLVLCKQCGILPEDSVYNTPKYVGEMCYNKNMYLM